MIKKTLFRCPSCSKPLKQGDRQYFCVDGHSFDIARQGYVDLLLPGHTGAGDPGDSKEMLRSRREFLDKGYYEEFSNTLNGIATYSLSIDKSRGEDSVVILDAGCGEGYYTVRLKNRLTGPGNPIKTDIYGIDVSKPAIQYASGRDRDIRFAVASNYHIPILTGSVDCVVCVFAPRDEREFRRILKPSGKLLVAAPGPRHLFRLRKALYESPDIIGPKGTAGEGFTLVERHNASYEIELKSAEDIFNLFTMTPYSRHADMEAAGKLKSAGEFVTEVDINIMVYRKS